VKRHPSGRSRGFTLVEVFTVLVTLVVLTAIAIPMWRNHLLRVRRADAMAALTAIQAEQDRFFARNARYASDTELSAPPPGGLGVGAKSSGGYYALELRTDADGLAYRAIARAVPLAGASEDARCVQMSLDHAGMRRAQDASGGDRSTDCWR
jgi:type IV pilus assembly protein PilE